MEMTTTTTTTKEEEEDYKERKKRLDERAMKLRAERLIQADDVLEQLEQYETFDEMPPDVRELAEKTYRIFITDLHFDEKFREKPSQKKKLRRRKKRND